MKKALFGLALISLVGCNSPVRTDPNGKKILEIPALCDTKKPITVRKDHYQWSVNCYNRNTGAHMFYDRLGGEKDWREYTVAPRKK